jgi:amino acid transporter
VSFLQKDLQPFPSIIAMASSGNLFLAALIAVGFLANAFQVTCNCFIGVSRIVVRMSRDGVLPAVLKLHEVNPKTRAPERAYYYYLAASMPVILGYFLISEWKSYTLGVTFACGYVFSLSALSLAKVSSSRVGLRMLAKSDIKTVPPWILISLGLSSFILSGTMVAAYMKHNYELATTSSVFVVIAVIVVCALVIFISKRMASKDRAILVTSRRE